MARLLQAMVLSWALAIGAAQAQNATQYSSRGLSINDPAAFTQSVALSMSRDRMEPIRRTMQEMLGVGQLSADLEVNITHMERYLGDQAGTEVVKLEDVSLAGALRRIYYMNSYPNSFLFTRWDFTRGADGWVLTGITFGSSWNSVNANPVTPGWTVTRD
ncbi:MAG: hypothetical protein H7124_12610 [Phycisphaerales bacterium]|nr:hypothetical protein [Hyphomonadaceae bacterium]